MLAVGAALLGAVGLFAGGYAGAGGEGAAAAREQAARKDGPKTAEKGKTVDPEKLEVATLGGGCFWCVEAVFVELKGVHKVVSGYSGGRTKNPTYKEVCNGDTGHAEVIQVHFDPAEISFEQLMTVFLTVHDPTTLNRQGADAGTQYRSVVFYASEAQKKTAEEVVKAIEAKKIWRDPIVTEISPLKEFYPAENYHQNYFAENPGQGYCRAVIVPKVVKFRKQYSELLKKPQ